MWQQLKIQLEPGDCAILEQQLLEAGALAISYLDAGDQPIYIDHPRYNAELSSKPLWENTCLLCLFDKGKDLELLLGKLKKNPVVKNTKDLSVEKIEDQEWERCWMKDFLPLQFGKNLWICPTSQTPPYPEATNIMLDPGLAFGSGSHPSTSLCLRWLEQAFLKNTEVIDYGCGSGVLSIAAVLLGANKVRAVDNDLQAIAATRDNSFQNSIPEGIITTCLPEDLPEEQVDILISNILAEPLLDLAVTFSRLVKPGGKVVLSGLLENQIMGLISCYKQWFDISEAVVDNGWGLLTGIRKA